MKKRLFSIVLVMVMLVALIVPAGANLVPDELIATIDVNTGAKYEAGQHTILTRIGDYVTVGEVTGYLLTGNPSTGKDYNWFYVYVVQKIDDNYIVTATYTELGRDTGIKSEVEIPKNGFLVCVNADDEVLTDSIKNSVEVGNMVLLENIDLDKLAILETGENPIESTGKVYFFTAKESDEKEELFEFNFWDGWGEGKSTYGFADYLPTVYIYFNYETEFYENSTVNISIVNSDGKEIVCRDMTDELYWYSDEWSDKKEGYLSKLHLIDEEMRFASEGNYTYIVQLFSGTTSISGEYDFYYTGWNQAESYEFNLSNFWHYKNTFVGFIDNVQITSILLSEDDLPVQGQTVAVTLMDGNRNIINTYDFTTESDGIIKSVTYEFTSNNSYAAPLYGQYTFRVEVKDNKNIWMEIDFEVSSGEGNIISIHNSVEDNVIHEEDIVIEEGEDIVIDVTDSDSDDVVIDVEALEKIHDAMVNSDEDISLVIVFDDATVTLDEKTLETLIKYANETGENVTITVKAIDEDALNEAQQNALNGKDVQAYISLEAWVGETQISDFEGGIVTVSIPFELPEGMDADSLTVAYVADDGTITILPTSYIDGMLVFETTHFSSYVVLADTEDAPYVLGDVNNDGVVDSTDVYYLLLHTMFGDIYPVNQPVDFNGDGIVDESDVYYLLLHTMFPDVYPLN